MLKVTLGELLLTAPWTAFPGLGEESEFRFAFSSASARTAFARKWLDAVIVLPDREVKLTSKETANEGETFLLTLKTGARSGHSDSEVRVAIIRKLVGKPAGHDVHQLRNCAAARTHNPDLPVREVSEAIATLIVEGIVERSPDYPDLYRLTSAPERRAPWLESG